LQRRHQKVVEEAPAPGMPLEMRHAMGEAAVKCAKAIGYRGAGTVEFIVDGSRGLKADGFFFMEMNTRLQVEHPVTEMITGLDLVEWQLRVASGEPLPKTQEELAINGHAVEVRLYAEDPAKGFLPSTGRLARLKLPQPDVHVRVDAGVVEGGEVTMFYDPMIAKIIAWDQTRGGALTRLADALETAEVAGPRTNLAFLIATLRHPEFAAGHVDTGFIDRFKSELITPASPAPADALVFAAVYELLQRRARANGDAQLSPWATLDGWRVGGARQREVMRFTDGGQDREVAIVYGAQGWRIDAGDGGVDVEASIESDGSIGASIGGRRTFARVLKIGVDVVVLMGGRNFLLRPHDPLEASEQLDHSNTDLRAPMPGKVVQVLTKPGDRVRRGQALAILEAMKMEHTLAAPGDLTVKTVPYRAGDQVNEGATIVSFEA
jgi:3-methylcrotonyl-CoA carboxylase alpha subunit